MNLKIFFVLTFLISCISAAQCDVSIHAIPPNFKGALTRLEYMLIPCEDCKEKCEDFISKTFKEHGELKRIEGEYSCTWNNEKIELQKSSSSAAAKVTDKTAATPLKICPPDGTWREEQKLNLLRAQRMQKAEQKQKVPLKAYSSKICSPYSEEDDLNPWLLVTPLSLENNYADKVKLLSANGKTLEWEEAKISHIDCVHDIISINESDESGDTSWVSHADLVTGLKFATTGENYFFNQDNRLLAFSKGASCDHGCDGVDHGYKSQGFDFYDCSERIHKKECQILGSYLMKSDNVNFEKNKPQWTSPFEFVFYSKGNKKSSCNLRDKKVSCK